MTDLAGTLARLLQEGVKVLEAPHRFGKSPLQAAMIESPDKMVTELVEGAASGEIQKEKTS